jgi:hypothetical protein
MPAKKPARAIVPIESVQQRIVFLRGQRVIIDTDLARLYGVTTKALNQARKRNPDRFLPDFMFRLTPAEKKEVVTNCDHLQSLKFSPQLPFAFTEHGAVMAANVLSSPKAIAASVFVVRAFIKLRELLSTHHELAAKLGELELRLQNHDEQILSIFDAIRQLMEDPEDPPKSPIGFKTEIEQSKKFSAKKRLRM